MGISQIGVSSTTVDTSKKPKLTYNTRYSWSTTGGTTARGALVYRLADNTLYKLDNYANTSTGAFAKFDLTSKTATNLTGLYATHNPIDVPGLISHPDGNIYCAPLRTGNGTYLMDSPKYTVSTNTWSTLGGSVTYGYNRMICNVPKIPSWFTNASDTVFLSGEASNVAALQLINATAAAKYSASTYDLSGLLGTSSNRWIEIKNGAEDFYPSAYFGISAPEASSSYSQYATIVRPVWDTSNSRASNALRLTQSSLPGWEKNTTYEASRYIPYGGGTPTDPVCLESRWMLFIANRGGVYTVDINTGDVSSTGAVDFVSSGGYTNPVYISSTKKLYFHATDQYLYEYDVTFG